MELEPGVPARLFHLTSSKNLTSILADGFTAAYGNYFSSTIEHAASFMIFRGGLDDLVAIEINTDGLDVSLSGDHSVAFFGHDDAWVVFDTISPRHIVAAYEVEIGFDKQTESC